MDKLDGKTYTKAEIEKFMLDLENAVGNEEKINEVLSYKNTGIIKEYLLSMGIKPVLVEYAGVVEKIKEDLRKELSDKNQHCEVTESGIRFYIENRKDKNMHVDENGVFHFDNSKHIQGPDENGKVYIIDSSEYLYETIQIGKYGNIERESRRGMGNEYSGYSRILEEDLPKVHAEATDGATYERHEETIDLGDPINPQNKNRTFKENYELFTGLYPNLKKWYDRHFYRDDKTIEEYSEYLMEKQKASEEEKKVSEIKDLETEISYYIKYLDDKNNEKNEKYDNLRRMIEFVKNFKRKSPIGKSVVDKVLENLKQAEKPKLEKVPEEYEQKENENNDEKKERLKRQLESLKIKYNNTYREEKYITQLIKLTKGEFEKIPLIGKKVAKVASKYENENTKNGSKVSLDDEDPIL